MALAMPLPFASWPGPLRDGLAGGFAALHLSKGLRVWRGMQRGDFALAQSAAVDAQIVDLADPAVPSGAEATDAGKDRSLCRLRRC